MIINILTKGLCTKSQPARGIDIGQFEGPAKEYIAFEIWRGETLCMHASYKQSVNKPFDHAWRLSQTLSGHKIRQATIVNHIRILYPRKK